VIAGATAQAERLVRPTIERRDLHVLGVFDDRLDRSPLNVVGVPVLGDLEALLTHRIMPSVDVIVVAIDPSAGARVDEVTSMLATLPLPNEVTLLVDRGDDRAPAVAPSAGAALAPLNAAVDLDRVAFAKRVQDLAIGVPA
jgi:FlaA1/EpsC-like NDP-sugar epimerase